jgi:hypothetical protein
MRHSIVLTIRIFFVLALARLFICSDTTEVERYEQILFDFGSESESLNLYDEVHHYDSEYNYSSDLNPLIDRVTLTFNFEDSGRREQVPLMSSNRNNRNNQDNDNRELNAGRALVPSQIQRHGSNLQIFARQQSISAHTTSNSANYQNFVGGAPLAASRTVPQSNYPNLAQNRIGHDNIHYRGYLPYDLSDIRSEIYANLAFKSLFVLLVMAIILLATSG